MKLPSMLDMSAEVMVSVSFRVAVNGPRNELSRVKDLRPHNWQICSHISGGSGTRYLCQIEIGITQPSSVDLELELS